MIDARRHQAISTPYSVLRWHSALERSARPRPWFRARGRTEPSAPTDAGHRVTQSALAPRPALMIARLLRGYNAVRAVLANLAAPSGGWRLWPCHSTMWVQPVKVSPLWLSAASPAWRQIPVAGGSNVQRFLVAYDGSESARQAAVMAAEMAKK